MAKNARRTGAAHGKVHHCPSHWSTCKVRELLLIIMSHKKCGRARFFRQFFAENWELSDVAKRVLRLTVYPHLEVQVGTGGETGSSFVGNDITFGDVVAH